MSVNRRRCMNAQLELHSHIFHIYSFRLRCGFIVVGMAQKGMVLDGLNGRRQPPVSWSFIQLLVSRWLKNEHETKILSNSELVWEGSKKLQTSFPNASINCATCNVLSIKNVSDYSKFQWSEAKFVVLWLVKAFGIFLMLKFEYLHITILALAP